MHIAVTGDKLVLVLDFVGVDVGVVEEDANNTRSSRARRSCSWGVVVLCGGC